MDLKNKTVVVLGTGGIGSEIAKLLAENAKHVIGLDSDVNKLKNIREKIGERFSYIQVDLQNPDSVRYAANKIYDDHGGFHIFVNAAGMYKMDYFWLIDIKDYEKIIDVNLKGLVYCYYYFINEYRKRKIANFNGLIKPEHFVDIGALTSGIIYGGNAVAASTKSAIRTLSLEIAAEIRAIENTKDNILLEKLGMLNGIRFSRVYPDSVDTGIWKYSENNLVAPIDSFPKIDPKFVAKAVKDVISGNYGLCDDVSVKLYDGKVCIGLHPIDNNGLPDFDKVLKMFCFDDNNIFIIVKDAKHGLGIFADRDFRKGEYILSIVGKVIDHQTEHSYQIDWDKHLDSEAPGRCFNHSCDPNAGIKTNKITGFPDIYAFRDIKSGEEIRIDYAMSEYTHYTRENPEDEFDLTCHCGSDMCRGKFGYFSELSNELKKKYKGFISDYLFKDKK